MFFLWMPNLFYHFLFAIHVLMVHIIPFQHVMDKRQENHVTLLTHHVLILMLLNEKIFHVLPSSIALNYYDLLVIHQVIIQILLSMLLLDYHQLLNVNMTYHLMMIHVIMMLYHHHQVVNHHLNDVIVHDDVLQVNHVHRLLLNYEWNDFLQSMLMRMRRRQRSAKSPQCPPFSSSPEASASAKCKEQT